MRVPGTSNRFATNWAGNVQFRADTLLQPTTLVEAQELIASHAQVRVVGSRHSFNHIADADLMIDTSRMPEICEIATDRRTVKVSGAMTYGRLAELLAASGLTVSNFASLPHISIAGAISTGTHGSGDTNPNLASAAAAIELVSGTGELVSMTRDADDYEGAVVSLGALGLIHSVTLDVVPTFEVTQRVYDLQAITAVAERADTLFAAGYSVSIFTDWRDGAQNNQLWIKHRVGDDTPDASADYVAKLRPADGPRHPIRTIDGSVCTDQTGAPGAGVDRLPHFRMEHSPSAGDEIQSEFFVPRDHANEALLAMSVIGDSIADDLMVGEVRTVAADDQWMSPTRGRDSLAFHFTWLPDQRRAEAAARRVVDALQPFSPRPHWGKVFEAKQFSLHEIPGLPSFLGLVDRLDPRGTFTNDWFNRTLRS